MEKTKQIRLAKMINKKTNQVFETTAKKIRKWEIGGDIPQFKDWEYLIAAKAQGEKWAWHKLKGNRLVLDDYLNDDEIAQQEKLLNEK